jgi:pimeloyl-[acyl-carrier protein] methyl ester esterase
MRLAFIHGWGLAPPFWDLLAERLTDYPQVRIDLGFYGEASPNIAYFLAGNEPTVLVGHSLGFVHGLDLSYPWTGWIAINSFTRFIASSAGDGCVPSLVLREMRQRFAADPTETLGRFCAMIGVEYDRRPFDRERLLKGLDRLRDADVTEKLASLLAPGLVLASQHDPLVPVAATDVLGEFASDGVAWNENGGHILPYKEPDWCAQKIASFLESLVV